MQNNQLHYISKMEADALVEAIKNIKHKCIILLMLDAGLRVSEACSLKLKDFDFKKQIINVRSLKKKSHDHIRSIPISPRLYRTLYRYFENNKIQLQPDNYIFPSSDKNKHLSRFTIWRVIRRYALALHIDKLHPHTLRHTFATLHLNNGTSLEEIKNMLGHKDYNTTLVYASIPQEKLKQRIASVSEPKSIIRWLKNTLLPQKQRLINLSFSNTYFTVGRNQTLHNINNLIAKDQNILIIGNTGVGKSHIINNIKTNKKILKLDDTDSIKKTLANILLYLYKDKNTVLNLLYKDFTTDEITKKIQRDNAVNLCNLIIKSTEEKEYILCIDNIDKITASAKKVLEKFKDHFTIITSARSVKANDTSFLWNFEIIRIDGLNRNYSFKLLDQLTGNIQYADKETLYNHIYEQTNGNPRAIFEMVNRYSKEPILTEEIIRSVKHTGALQEYDMSFLIVLTFGIMTAMRYASRELDQPALRMIGSIGLILLILFRPFMASFKKKTI